MYLFHPGLNKSPLLFTENVSDNIETLKKACTYGADAACLIGFERFDFSETEQLSQIMQKPFELTFPITIWSYSDVWHTTAMPSMYPLRYPVISAFQESFTVGKFIPKTRSSMPENIFHLPKRPSTAWKGRCSFNPSANRVSPGSPKLQILSEPIRM